MKVKLLSLVRVNPKNLSIAVLDMLQTSATLQGRHLGRTEISNQGAEFLGGRGGMKWRGGTECGVFLTYFARILFTSNEHLLSPQ